MSFLPIDEPARQRARSDHATSLIVEAGAGTGKTTLLVDRIAELVCSGRARLDEIAAVTFTENAATGMKLRLRERLEQLRVGSMTRDQRQARAAAALEVLERATISTIHALCAALLQERPLECGVVPGFRVADDAETDLLFAEAWESWLADRLLGNDPVLAEALDQGIPLEGHGSWGERSSLRGLARVLLEQRDLVPVVAEAPDAAAWCADLLEQADRARELIAGVPEADALAGRLWGLIGFAETARGLAGAALGAHLRMLPRIPKNLGFRKRWPSDAVLAEARALAEWTQRASDAWAAALGASLHGDLTRALLGVVERYEQAKRAAGVLDFLDLLLLARNALREREVVRRYFRERWRYLLIDELQDTDPLQVEIAELLAGGAAGRLFVVGDAKQSIYRFRRAEVALFRRLSREAAERSGWDVLRLDSELPLAHADRAFRQPRLRRADPGVRPGRTAALRAHRCAARALRGAGRDRVALQRSVPTEGEELLEAEAAALSRLVAAAAHGGYEVRDPPTGAPRSSRAGDVMVLVRRLTQVRHLEEALEAGGSALHGRGRQVVLRSPGGPRGARGAAGDRGSRAIAWRSWRRCARPSSGSATATSSGTPWRRGGCGMPRRTRAAGGRGARTGPAAAASAPRGTHPAQPGRAAGALYDETRVRAALTRDRRGEAAIANLDKVVALARQASDLDVLTLRGFAALLEERVASSREEPDLPVTRPGDPDTIRILTIHRAKGLEAPVVALYDTADDFGGWADVIPLREEGRVAIGFRKGCQPPGWEELTLRDQARTWAEGRRLLYVACTRARDLLVIPRPPSDAASGSSGVI